MSLRRAIWIVENFRRYRVVGRGKRERSVWDQTGEYVPQCLIPRVTKAGQRKLDRLMGTKDKLGAIRWVDVGRIKSTQHCLKFRSLRWNVRNHEVMQKTFGTKRTDMDVRGVNLPILCWVDGVPVIWNGNHRVTANILLGKKRILVRMFKKRR